MGSDQLRLRIALNILQQSLYAAGADALSQNLDKNL